MTEIIGTNTPASEKVMGFVTEVERLEASIKELQLARTALYAAAKSQGYSPPGIRYVVKCRKMKPQVREEAETTRDIYMHAAGMAVEPPLYRQIATLAKDSAAGEKLLDAFKLLVPLDGELICTIGGRKMRLWRDKDGQPQSAEYTPVEVMSALPGRSSVPAPVTRDVPNCSADEAEELGRKAYRENKPIIDNPFPFGDARVPRWDRGWRSESGSNGMGNGN
jgi:uncharacterized protein (UPF0335 family)